MSDIIYGIHAIQSLAKHHPKKIEKVIVQESNRNDRVQGLLTELHAAKVPVETVDKKTFERYLPNQARHQGIIAQYQALTVAHENDLLKDLQQKSNVLVLILDAIKDPHNFGACLRSAAAAGVDAVIYPKDKSVQLTSAVHHVSAGASFALELYQITNLARVMRQLADLGIWIYGTDADAKQTLYDCDFSGSCALVMGAEGEGMRQLTAKHCDHLINIPMTDSVESLNVSVATAVCLFEIRRQKKAR